MLFVALCLCALSFFVRYLSISFSLYSFILFPCLFLFISTCLFLSLLRSPSMDNTSTFTTSGGVRKTGLQRQRERNAPDRGQIKDSTSEAYLDSMIFLGVCAVGKASSCMLPSV